MDEVSARADVADAVSDSRLAVTVPKGDIERVLASDEDIDLVLDVVRTNGEREDRRIFLAWDRDTLRKLVDESGEQIVVLVDPESLQAAFDADVEAHGLREMGATLAIAVTALGGAGAAGAAVSQDAFQPGVTDFPSITATVGSEFQSGVTDFPSITSGAPGAPGAAQQLVSDEPGGPGDLRPAQAAPEAGMPRAMPSDYAAQIQAQHEAAGNLLNADIEQVRAGGTAIPDPDSAIENVRATRAAPEPGDSGGIAIDAPSTGVTAALAGGIALTIAAAAFALRRKREPGLA
jgi:hypothetical protein